MIKFLLLILLMLFSINLPTIPKNFWALRYDERGIPLIDAQIEGRSHTLMLDTGSAEGIHLYQDHLDKLIANPALKVTHQTPRRMIDISGGQNTVSSWKFNQLMISNILFKDVEIVANKPWGFSIGDEVPKNEVLGLGIFHHRRVLMDFKNDRLQIIDHLPSNISKWSAYSVKRTVSGLRITAFVENTPLHLIVDTAASHSLLFSNHLPPNTLFSGCQTIEPGALYSDCRVTKFTVPDTKGKLRNDWAIVTNDTTPSKLDFDGLLGIKFMRAHQVILDMPENKLYISP